MFFLIWGLEFGFKIRVSQICVAGTAARVEYCAVEDSGFTIEASII